MGKTQDRLDAENRLVQEAINNGAASDKPTAREGYAFCVRGSLVAAGTGEMILALCSMCFTERTGAQLWLEYYDKREHQSWDKYEVVEVELVGYLRKNGDDFAREMADKHGGDPTEGLRRHFAAWLEGTRS